MIDTLDYMDRGDDDMLARVIAEFEMQKARQRQFSSRSEAGRYAAQIRWGNRGATASGTDTGMTQEQKEIAELQGMMAEAQALSKTVRFMQVGGVDGFSTRTPELTEAEWESYDGDSLIAVVNGLPVPTKRGAELEAAKQAVGEKAVAIAEDRLARQGIVPLSESETKKIDDHLALVRKERAEAQVEWMREKGRTDADPVKVRAAEQRAADLLFEEKNFEARKRVYSDALKEETLAVVAEARPTGGTFKINPLQTHFSSTWDSDVAAMVDTVQTVIPRDILDGLPTLRVTGGTRGGTYGSYSDSERRILMRAGMGERQFRSTGLHEVGHAIQYNFPAAKAFDSIWVARRIRTGGAAVGKDGTTTFSFWKQKPLKAKDRDRSDAARDGIKMKSKHEDEFQRPYTGVNYRSGETGARPRTYFAATEVLTTGLQNALSMTDGDRYLDRDLLAHTAGVLLSVALP